MQLRAVLIPAWHLDPSGVRAWRALADRAVEPNPFARPEFVLPAATSRRGVVELAVVLGDGQWLACLPVVRSSRWGRIPLPCLAPWLPAYAYLAAPLLDRDHVGVAAGALADLVLADRAAGALVLDPIDPQAPASAALLAAVRTRGVAPLVHADFERAALRRRPENTYLADAVSGAGRKKLRKQARGLASALGGDLETRDRSDDPSAVEAFLAMEAAGWKGEQGTALASTAADAAFFRAMCEQMAAAGRLQLLTLEAGGRIAAMQCNLLDGSELYAFKVAYAPDLARHSPGATLEIEAMDVFHAAGLELADSCAAPDSTLVNRLWADRRRMQTVLVPTRSAKGRLVKPALRAEATARSAHRRLRELRASRRAAGAGAH